MTISLTFRLLKLWNSFQGSSLIILLLLLSSFFSTAKGNVPEAIKGGFLSCDTDMQKGILPRKSIFSSFCISVCLICLFVAYLRWTDERWNGWNNGNSYNPQKSENILCKSEYIFGILSDTKWLCTNGKYQWYMLIFNVYFLFIWLF